MILDFLNIPVKAAFVSNVVSPFLGSHNGEISLGSKIIKKKSHLAQVLGIDLNATVHVFRVILLIRPYIIDPFSFYLLVHTDSASKILLQVSKIPKSYEFETGCYF